MNAIQASLQKIYIECLEAILAPIVRLTLYCGLGHSEFAAAVRRVFIDVASEQYGVRGRPANIAKVSAKTGLPRKAIHRHRRQPGMADWTPDEETSPLNTIIHYWRFGQGFCKEPGSARELTYEGDDSFTTLVKSCVGDIPVSTIRQQLIREGIVLQREDGLLALRRDYSFPERIDQDFLRSAAFSLRNLAATLTHNTFLVGSGKGTEEDHRKEGRFERVAWSRHLSQDAATRFQTWAREHGAEFIEGADEYVSRIENRGLDTPTARVEVAGVGLYFFRED